jgi:phenylacetic acid degradation operon negative regulatory protein
MTYKLNARHLILDILYAAAHNTASIKQILCAAQLLGISDNGIRVAVTRLVSEQIIFAVSRGVYCLHEAKFDTTAVSLNKTSSIFIQPTWQGDYVLVYTGALGRVDRSALAKREKTLRYYGFAELEQNVFIRPNNLGHHLIELKTAMVKFGLESAALFFKVTELENTEQLPLLWDIEQLNQAYVARSEQIKQWYSLYPSLSLADAAKSAFDLGKSCLFQLRRDPLLPSEWIDSSARAQFEKDAIQMEQQGQQLWQQYFKYNSI